MGQSRAKRYRGFPSQAAYRRAQKRRRKLDVAEDQQFEHEYTRPEPYVPERLTQAELDWLASVVKRFKARERKRLRASE